MKIPTISPNLSRLFALIFAIIAILAIFVLAAGMESIRFEPAKPYAIGRTNLPTGAQQADFDYTWLLITLTVLMGILVVIGVVLLAVSPEARKVFMRYFWPVVFLLSVYAFVLYMSHPNNAKAEETPEPTPTSLGDHAVLTTPIPLQNIEKEEVFETPTLPKWQSYLIGSIVMLLVGLAVYFIWRNNQSNDDDLFDIAKTALRDLSSGRDWEDAVIQCYVKMNQAVSRQRQLNRDSAMTPAEFAAHLVNAGMPAEPIDRLTRLFEKARYSTRSSHTNEVDEATACLTEIMQAIEAHR